MNVGDHVTIVPPWHSFAGRIGRVVAIEPRVMVQIDGECLPLRIEPSSLVVLPVVGECIGPNLNLEG